jgi:hypothetical protein
VRADATAALPIRTAGVDVVTAVWWLHMVDDPRGVLREVSRILRPGGIFITTADKQAVDELTTGNPAGRNWTGDTCGLLASAGQQVGLHLAGAAAFGVLGHTGPAIQGRDLDPTGGQSSVRRVVRKTPPGVGVAGTLRVISLGCGQVSAEPAWVIMGWICTAGMGHRWW